MKRTVSGIVLTLLLLGTFTLVFDVERVCAQTTIYINSNGSVTPSNAPLSSVDNITYTLTGNITYPTYNGIIVERSNIIINGNGHTVLGNTVETGSCGLNVTDLINVTIKNLNIKSFQYGISLYDSNDSTISGNILTDDSVYGYAYGIWLAYSSNNIISGNTLSANHEAILLSPQSSCNIITGNNIIENTYNSKGIYVDGVSENNVVIRNNVTARTLNLGTGIIIHHSSYNTIGWNTVTRNGLGIYVEFVSGRNTIIGNDLIGNYQGIILNDIAVNNIITENNIVAAYYPIVVTWSSSNNLIFHNNFASSYWFQGGGYDSPNPWDDGYPSGGNYWSNYNGADSYKGPYQNITGSDGIGDTPYTIDAYNRDNYPFMKANGWSTYFTMINLSLTPNPAYVGQTVTLLGKLIDHIGQSINGAKIYLYVNNSIVGTLSTNSSGWFQASSKVSTAGHYDIRAFYNGSSVNRPCNQTETLTVKPKTNTTIQFTLSPNPATKGQTITLAGNLKDQNINPIANKPVDIYYSVNNGYTWTYAGTIVTNSTGGFKATGKLTVIGTYMVGVQYKGNFMYNTSNHIETLVVNA